MFKKIDIQDKELLESYFNKTNYDSCELTFANLYLWSQYFCLQYCIVEDALIIKECGEKPEFRLPVTDGPLKKPVEWVINYCKENNFEPVFQAISPEMFQDVKKEFGDEFTVEYNRDIADYVYSVEDLINLKGKKYHGKRNHINRFKENNNWSYESIHSDNLNECFEMLEEWMEVNKEYAEQSMMEEYEVTKKFLKDMELLNQKGGLIRVDGKVIAFTIGEPLNKNTFVIHIEKAFGNIQGAYPIINQQFLLHEVSDYLYVNREEDMGDEGLRKAKLSYRPVRIIEKGKMRLVKNVD